MAEKLYNPLVEHRQEVVSQLDAHVDSLIERFSSMELLSEKDTSTLDTKPNQEQQRINFLIDIIHDKLEQHDSKLLDEAIAYMRSTQDYFLIDLAKKLTSQDEVPCATAVQPMSTPPVENGKIVHAYIVVDVIDCVPNNTTLSECQLA